MYRQCHDEGNRVLAVHAILCANLGGPRACIGIVHSKPVIPYEYRLRVLLNGDLIQVSFFLTAQFLYQESPQRW